MSKARAMQSQQRRVMSRLTQSQIEGICRLYAKRLDLKRQAARYRIQGIADRYGYNYNTIWKIIKGQIVASYVLTEEQIQTIKNEYQIGRELHMKAKEYTHTKIAHQVGVSKQTVWIYTNGMAKDTPVEAAQEGKTK